MKDLFDKTVRNQDAWQSRHRVEHPRVADCLRHQVGVALESAQGGVHAWQSAAMESSLTVGTMLSCYSSVG